MKSHSLLSNQNIDVFKPLEQCMLNSFEKTKGVQIPPNKSFFALSLKHFFKTLSDDLLDLMCHNYVHHFITDHIKRTAK